MMKGISKIKLLLLEVTIFFIGRCTSVHLCKLKVHVLFLFIVQLSVLAFV